ncbi:hypothetical protein GQ600_2240 [Phytophthora cactorum]|nr:hypothetical protein GQ600_5451 [Phytophthora cactorum]KAF1782437.1 hypothetical protein GQ600_2240 [Phytophthora cactorum]
MERDSSWTPGCILS